ncbi:MAG: hypothetical protein KGL39_26895 [Patescibacteria group bacterium]|nr:hypothetical protein [Patescibacteria group bacterium]
MLKEFLDALTKLVLKGHNENIVTIPGEPDYIYGLMANGRLEKVKADPPLRNHTAGDLRTIVAFAKRVLNQESGGDGESGQVPAIWYDRTGVVCLLDDEDRRERVTLPLKFHPQLELMMELERYEAPMDTDYFLNLCCHRLAGCLLSNSKLTAMLDILEKNPTLMARKEAWAKIQAKQDELYLYIPIFTNRSLVNIAAVKCSFVVEVHEEEGLYFLLRPLPGAIEEAIHEAEKYIGDQIRADISEDVVFYGRP